MLEGARKELFLSSDSGVHSSSDAVPNVGSNVHLQRFLKNDEAKHETVHPVEVVLSARQHSESDSWRFRRVQLQRNTVRVSTDLDGNEVNTEDGV